MAEIEAERQEMRKDQNGRHYDTDSISEDSESYDPRARESKLDKDELRRKEKADRQRNLIGKQPQPDLHTSPKIAPMGNQKIIRK